MSWLGGINAYCDQNEGGPAVRVTVSIEYCGGFGVVEVGGGELF